MTTPKDSGSADELHYAVTQLSRDLVAEKEAHAATRKDLEAWRERCRIADQDLAIAGVRGSPPPGQETIIGAWSRRAHEAESALAAERSKSEGLRAALRIIAEMCCMEHEDDEHEDDCGVSIARAALAQAEAPEDSKP